MHHLKVDPIPMSPNDKTTQAHLYTISESFDDEFLYDFGFLFLPSYNTVLEIIVKNPGNVESGNAPIPIYKSGFIKPGKLLQYVGEFNLKCRKVMVKSEFAEEVEAWNWRKNSKIQKKYEGCVQDVVNKFFKWQKAVDN